MWYSSKLLFSHNRLLNFVMSHRGGGKTYEGKKYAINNFLKNKKKFMYIRRYKTELTNVHEFFDDIRTDFDGVKLEVKGRKFYINDKLAGYAVALTQQVQIRSTPYPDVTFILFDEFILDPEKTLKYLKSEVETFLEILSTVIRSRDDVRVLCCANSISYVNPYFEYWNLRVKPSDTQGFYKSTNSNQVILELFESDEFKEMMLQTKFGQLINNTRYGDYAINNKVLKDNSEFIRPLKPNDSYFVCGFKYDNKEYGLWFSNKEQIYHCNNQLDPTSKNKYSVTLSDHSLDFNSIKLLKHKGFIKAFSLYYYQGFVYYKNQNTKNDMLDIFKYLGL